MEEPLTGRSLTSDRRRNTKGSMDAALNIPEDKLVEYLENPEEADMESGTIGDGKAGKRA